MHLGDTLRLEPTIYAQCGFERVPILDCTVIYIHPRRRFYVVEFCNARGQRWREARYFPHSEADTGDLWRREARFNNRRRRYT